jgi:DNA-binding Xre family transcriptional regulator
MTLEWRLRRMMAERGVWTGAELARLLLERAGYRLTAASISALLRHPPRQMRIETLDALCTALECSPSDLLLHTPSQRAVAEELPEARPHAVGRGRRPPPPA